MDSHTVCRADELPVGKMKAFRIGGQGVLVFHLEDGFYATQSACTHMFAPLSRGKILDDCKVQCPLHHARFDIRSGKVVDWANFPPGVQLLDGVRGKKPLKTFPVSVAKGEVHVKL